MKRNTTPLSGGCLCGAVRYESEKPARKTGICHCGMCRKSTGSFAAPWVSILLEDVKFTDREPTWFASSDKAQRAHCSRCGSQIGYKQNDSDILYFWVGTTDNPELYPPQMHCVAEDALSWDPSMQVPLAAE